MLNVVVIHRWVCVQWFLSDDLKRLVMNILLMNMCCVQVWIIRSTDISLP